MIDTHHKHIPFGKFKGELWTRVPVNYLLWLSNQKNTDPGKAEWREYARAELKRRGTIVPELEVSAHAVNRASLACLDIWKQDAKEKEGLHSWLCRVSMEAFVKLHFREVLSGTDVQFSYKGMKFVFHLGEMYPIVKTVMRSKA